MGSGSRWQAQAAQFISPHSEDVVQQSNYQAEEDDGSDDGTDYHPGICRRSRFVNFCCAAFKN